MNKPRGHLQMPSPSRITGADLGQAVDIVAVDATLQSLDEQGWAMMAIAPDVDLRSVVPILRPQLAARLAEVCVERISPKSANQARHGTMSALYGLGSFPLHTERAHWRRAPRFVVFRSVGEITNRPTTLLDSYCH